MRCTVQTQGAPYHTPKGLITNRSTGLRTQLGSYFVANPWVPSVALQCFYLLVVKEA